jgi:hypothetical protein
MVALLDVVFGVAMVALLDVLLHLVLIEALLDVLFGVAMVALLDVFLDVALKRSWMRYSAWRWSPSWMYYSA